VFLAIQQLLQEGDSAFDALIGHFEDKRYSISYDAPSGIYDSSVGSVCKHIMRASIYCYEDLGTLKQFTSGQHYPHEMAQLKLAGWWKQNRTKPLWRIQVAMIDHQIAYFKELDLAKAPPVHPLAERLPLKTLEELRSLNIARLEAMKAGIIATKEAYRPKSIDQFYGRFTWLPWGTYSFNK
jgi:hypothetical protein